MKKILPPASGSSTSDDGIFHPAAAAAWRAARDSRPRPHRKNGCRRRYNSSSGGHRFRGLLAF
ncbi:MAG: hypothetical protein AB7F40_05105 [Victivallaceae bacterium]